MPERKLPERKSFLRLETVAVLLSHPAGYIEEGFLFVATRTLLKGGIFL